MKLCVALELRVDAPGGAAAVLVKRNGEEVAAPAEVEIEVRPGGDLGGPWVSGPKGHRFVYAGLPGENGTWLRRWKWRAEQLRALNGGERVTLVLGDSVTPEVRLE